MEAIVNGLRRWGFDAAFTFISPSGSSVVDYVLLSHDLCIGSFVKSFVVGTRIESKHMPLCLQIHTANHKETAEHEWAEKLIWDPDGETEFIHSLTSTAMVEMLARATAEIEHDTDRALQSFIDVLLQS
ncbi:hypothetical protein BaRGS_00003318, partial [Batillaria attramentaria]